MKTKLVLWGQKGSEEAPEKILLALALNAEQNKVESWVFEGETATEELAEQLMNNWRKDEVVLFPENNIHVEFELSAGGSLLPEGVSSTEKDDLLKRTQTEWLFIVLSTKLFKTYEGEVEEIRERVEALPKYNKSLWEELKEFQNKIQAQAAEQNLFREHTNLLRERINGIFGQLKKLREVEDKAFEDVAKVAFDKIVEKLRPIEEAVANNNGDWTKCFDKLKELQRDLKNAKLTREGRNELWERIDKAFKEVKDRRFGGNSAGANAGGSGSGPANNETRLLRRIEGLKSALQKMQDSVNRDEKEFNFQDKKINSGNASQLETQLREVKSKMVKERLDSKKEKLTDMQKTLSDLENRLAKMLAKQAEAKAEEEAKAAETVVVPVVEVEETTGSNEVSSDEVVEETVVEAVEETVIETIVETPPTEEVVVVEPVAETSPETTTEDNAEEVTEAKNENKDAE
jgi:DNA repair exonuclease SbcCD ATPase subunit